MAVDADGPRGLHDPEATRWYARVGRCRVAVATTFYNALFGWEISEIPGFEGYPMWQAPNGISGGGLAPAGEGLEHPRSYVEVDSIDEALDKATAGGGSVVMAKAPISPTSWFAVLAEPDGNHIGLYEGTT